MRGFFSRSYVHSLMLVSFAAAALACSSEARSETPAAKSDVVLILANSGESARIVSVYREKAATHYAERAQRSGEDDVGLEPAGYHDVVKARIEVADPSSRFDDNDGLRFFTVSIDPAQLTLAQTQALAQPKMADRVAAFHLRTTRVLQVARRVDAVHSLVCNSDSPRCDDRYVYETVARDVNEVSVD
jgi:hypothetical protein